MIRKKFNKKERLTNKDKKILNKKKSQVLTIRSSAAEYLTFIAAGCGSETSVEMPYENENIWLTQKMTHATQHSAISRETRFIQH